MHYVTCIVKNGEVNVRYVILADLGTAMFYNTPIL